MTLAPLLVPVRFLASSALRTRLLLIGSLVILLAAASFAFSLPTHAQGFVGPKKYYLALAFGLQPIPDWNDGYNDDFFGNLRSYGAQQLINMACPDETSSTFLTGGCPYHFLVKYDYATSQLQAAVRFIKSHPGQVSPVTLDIGANDVLGDINPSTCTVRSTWLTDLATVRKNLATILSQIKSALNGSGDLLLMNYYDPYQNECPNSVTDVQQVNTVIASDAANSGVPVADVFRAFGGATVPNPKICTDTWMCNRFYPTDLKIHATDHGYGVINLTFEKMYGK